MPSSRIMRSRRPIVVVFLLLMLTTAFGVSLSTVSDIALDPVVGGSGLSNDESAYYEYVSPRLDRLVSEVDDVVVMVEGKSRDIIALSVSGARIDELTGEITKYGDTHGVPERFADIHASILDATGTATYTFDQARQALRSFDFSGMTGLVSDFESAAEGLHKAQDALKAYANGAPAQG